MKEIFLEEVDSTNLYGKSNLDALDDRTVIHALSQTSGRGRFTRAWKNLGAGNLFLSFVLKPSNDFRSVYSNLTQYLSVVLCNILESYGITPQIKWPNDVLVNNKKIAGILSETVMQGQLFRGLVLGIGVNLNATFDLLGEIDKPATALNLEIGRNVDVFEFKNYLVSEFFAEYDKFLETGFEYIKSKYISRADFLDKEICVQIFDKKSKGIARSITDNGELVLDSKGKNVVLTIGDIL